MIDRIGKETKAAPEASHYIRRDLAMLVGLCVAPGKGSPRRWPKSALIVARQREGFTVKLWDKKVGEQGLCHDAPLLPLLAHKARTSGPP
jgi:hypothetical protein